MCHGRKFGHYIPEAQPLDFELMKGVPSDLTPFEGLPFEGLASQLAKVVECALGSYASIAGHALHPW